MDTIPATSSRWVPFTAGVALGVVAGLLGIGAAVALNRRQRHTLSSAGPTLEDEARLDEELDQTFPASDPLPHSHRVD